MEQCSRCGRCHTGICGIPGVAGRIGMGGNGHRRFASSISPDSWHINGKPPRPATKSRSTCPSLQRLLQYGVEEELKALDMLKALPPDMEEYTLAMEKLDSLQYANHQVRLQLAQRRRQ